MVRKIVPFFLKPVTCLKIDIRVDMFDRTIIIAFKETIQTKKVKVSSRLYRRVGRVWDQKKGKKTSINN